MKMWKTATLAILSLVLISSCQNQASQPFTNSDEPATSRQVNRDELPPDFAKYTPFPKAAPTNRQEFCAGKKNIDHHIRLAFEPSNQLAFDNRGGLLNGGVCWWHSLFTRSALYLAIFRPDLPRPTEAQARKLVHSIAAGKRVVEIPGYKNLWEFSEAWPDLIQAKLEEWQRVDGFLKFAWIRGLSGGTQINPAKLETNLLHLIDGAQSNGDVSWTMFQMSGITAHAGLVIGGKIESNNAGIARLEIPYVDSNFSGEISYLEYEHGKRSITNRTYGNFVPYLGRTRDLARFKAAAASYCQGDILPATLDESLSNDFY